MRYTIVQFILLSMLIASRAARDDLLLFEKRAMMDVGGMALVALGVTLATVAFLNLRASFRVSPEPRTDAVLVTRGIYRFLRHPMYTSVVLVTAGLFLTKPTANMGISAAAIVIFFLIKARYEEKKLRERYAGYGEYAARSFGVLPLWRGL